MQKSSSVGIPFYCENSVCGRILEVGASIGVEMGLFGILNFVFRFRFLFFLKDGFIIRMGLRGVRMRGVGRIFGFGGFRSLMGVGGRGVLVWVGRIRV
jgi:hypothetical protein